MTAVFRASPRPDSFRHGTARVATDGAALPGPATPGSNGSPAGEATGRLDCKLVRQSLQAAGNRSGLEWIAEQVGLSEEALLPDAAAHFGLRALDMTQLRSLTPAFGVASFAECKRRSCVIGVLGNDATLTAVVADPTDARLRRWIETRLQDRAAEFALTTRADLHAFLAGAEKSVRAMDVVKLQQGKAATADAGQSISIANIDATESPVVRLVDSTLYDALRSGASDIHLETQPGGMLIKYRLDGVLEVVKEIDDLETAHQAISRIKVVADLDIAERRIPQDGRFQVVVDEARHRLSRLDHAEHVRRGRGAPRPGPQAPHRAVPRADAGHPRIRRRRAARHPRRRADALRHAARHRSDRKRQDDHALCGALGDQHRPRQDRHDRGPGRIPAARRAADPGQREEGADVRARPALDPAPRPGQDHGRRDPRRRDRADRGPVRADRAIWSSPRSTPTTSST